MELLKQRIRKDGLVKAGNVLKVDSFLTSACLPRSERNSSAGLPAAASTKY